MTTISASNSLPGAGMSTDIRSKPQFSHSSTPWMFSKPHCGQIIASRAGRLLALDGPSLAAAQQLAEIACTLPGDGVLDLADHQLVVSRPINTAQDADRDGEVGPPHPRQHVREIWILCRLVVNEQICLSHAVFAQRDDLGMQSVEPDALVA